MRAVFIAIILTALLVAPAQADEIRGKKSPFSFATAEQGRDILTRRDDFVQRLSAFDRAARLKTDRNVSETSYLEFVAANVLSWAGEDKAIVEAAVSEIWERIDSMSLPWPQTIYLIKTTGYEEGGAAYTRGNGIVLPTTMLVHNRESLRKIISHELFHILARQNPALKERLYAAIGFVPCGELAFPSKIKSLKITNPDAPRNEHCIRLNVANKQVWASPILYSKGAYDVRWGGEFFDYVNFQFLLLEGTAAAVPSSASYNDANFQLVDVGSVSGFFQQVGKNTEYIIHPEEILADNFAFLVLGRENVPSPEVLKRVQDILEHARIAQPAVRTGRAR